MNISIILHSFCISWDFKHLYLSSTCSFKTCESNDGVELAFNSHLSLGEVTVDQAIGGARDVQCMYYETSLLDAQEVVFVSLISLWYSFT